MASATLVQDSSAGNTCPVPFTFKDHEIRTVAIDDQPWFVAKDVSKALGIAWCGRTLAQIPGEWSTMCNLHIDGKRREVKIIAEPAVYKLAFRSNKPEADAFTNWVASEVLPAIRKTGQFTAPVQALPIGPLTPAQCRHLHDVIDAKVSALPKEVHRAAYAEAWTRFNRHFRIAKYEQLPQEKFSDGLAYLISMQVKAAQKALPAGTTPRPRHTMPTASHIQGLVENVKFRGSEMHKAMDDLWAAIWPDYGRYGGDHGRFVSMAQLRYVSEDIFRMLSNNVESCRRMASTVAVNYGELCRLRDERG